MTKDNKKTFLMFLLACLVGFTIVSLIEVLRSTFQSPVGPDVQSASAVSAEGSRPLSFADLADKVKPVVVNISTTKIIKERRYPSPFWDFPFDRFFFGDEFFERFFGDIPRRQFKQQSLGSGFIISSDGYIFTNNHVVERADKIIVKLSNGQEYEAKIIGRDPKTDIALIKIKPRETLPVAELGDSDKLRVGEWVIAIGNPFGLEHTVTAGIVSAKGRVIGAGPYDDFIQTDASINPGNSGGPLFNMEGKVVGINTAIVANAQGIGFAIPINMAKTILADLKSKGKVTRGWLGISVQDVTEDMARALNLKDNRGAIVSEVFQGEPADRAGLKAGDIFIEINGKKIKNSHELLLLIASCRVGETISAKVLRDGKELTFHVVVAERPEHPEVVISKGTKDDLGLTVEDITPEIAKYFDIPRKGGVVVVKVKRNSIADEVGIQPGDIILEVNKVKVNSTKEFHREITKPAAKKSVMLRIKRGSATFYVVLKK